MSGRLKVLRSGDEAALGELLAQDPIANCFVAARLEVAGLEPWRLGGEVWGWFEDRELVAGLFLGANLIPIGGTPRSRTSFSERAMSAGRHCSSIVGPSEEVLALWQLLASAWGPAREIRADQPLLAMDRDSQMPSDELVRPATLEDLDLLIPACIAMFTEEVGAPPFPVGGSQAYRNRVAELVKSERAYVRIIDGQIAFKAEVGAVSRAACQVQGVWVDPALRGKGFSVGGMAAVVAAARQKQGPIVSLYVNDYNTVARATYARVGFRPVGQFATILF